MRQDYDMVAAAGLQAKRSSERYLNNLSIIGRLMAELDQVSGGRLYIRHRDGRVNFIEYIDGKHYGITRDMDRVYLLARRDYIKCRLDYLQTMDENYAETVKRLMKKYLKAGLDLNRIILTKMQYEWQKFPQSAAVPGLDLVGGVHDDMFAYNGELIDVQEERLYVTGNGVFVRNEIEQKLGDMMEAMGVPYRYEPALVLEGKEYHPAFAVMLEDSKLVLVECIEDSNLEEDVYKAAELLFAYAKADILLGRSLFFAFERDLYDESHIKAFLNEVLGALPQVNSALEMAVRLNRKN